MTRTGVAAGALAVVAWASSVSAQTLTQDEALALAFPGAEVERRTAFLDEAQLARASALAGPDVDVESTVVTYYVAIRRGEPAGVAYFDADRVRTLPQVLMIVVGTDGRLVRVETVSFRDPPESPAPGGCRPQCTAPAPAPPPPPTGAARTPPRRTLTSGAVTRATRRVMALHAIIDPFSANAR